MALPTPKVLRNEQNIQYRYELPHRLYCTAYHPSNAIVYGHENGVRIITRSALEPPSRLDFDFGQTTQLAVLATQHVVFAAACADAVRLVALPNTTVTLSTAVTNAVAITLADKHIVVVAHSPDVTGILYIHRVPFTEKDGIYKFSEHTSQTQYLSSPARSISFATNLLVVDKTACRIFAGTWLIALYPGKTILDARWIQGGKAIVALLADGEWGIWDIAPGSKGLLGQSIRGGAYAPFTISGWIEGPPVKTRATSKFTPMTPITRKIADVLFGGRNATSGQISVSPLPKTSWAGGVADECVVFWLEDSYAIIPSLRSFYENLNKRGGALFGGSGAGHTRLEGVTLFGERCTGIVQGATSSSKSIPAEIIIGGEHRLVILSDVDPSKSTTRRTLGPVENRIMALGTLDVEEIDEALERMENGSPQHKRKIKFNG